MVTSEMQSKYRNGVYSSTATFFGLSTDTKPTGDTVGNGSFYVKIDLVGKTDENGNPVNCIACYDAENEKWYPDDDEEGT